MITANTNSKADVCLILEGTYPFVTGGVSIWAHQLIREQSHLSFQLVAIVPKDAELELKYDLPSNVVGLTTVVLGNLPQGRNISGVAAERIHRALREPLAALTGARAMELSSLKAILEAIGGGHGHLGSQTLLDDEAAWQQLIDLYEAMFPEQSFLDYFWSYRAIIGGVYSVLLAPLPRADMYHAMSTGYAGLMAARAKIETGKPVAITEHGIYTSERRIEIASADWLDATASKTLTIDRPRRDLRDMWIDSIHNFSHAAYQAADAIITLFRANQKPQLEDGADPSKMLVIANGVNIGHYAALTHPRSASATVALIGRVVPIKDIKTFLRACAIVKQEIPDFFAYILGPTDEDEGYYEECLTLVKLLGLNHHVEFTGRVAVEEYLLKIDLMVLTSISEAQPLVMLEAGAAGIPIVATDVGACREIIEGLPEESPALGAGGIVTPLASPVATAEAILTLLADPTRYEAASRAIKQRIAEYYNEGAQNQSYRNLYATYLKRNG